MGIFFSGSELLEIAAGIEENGMAFYEALAGKTGDRQAKDTYEYLAGEEKRHLDTFQGMAKSLGQAPAPETYTEEYALYLKALVDSAVFPNIAVAERKATKVCSDDEAIDAGIQAEKDSILFYTDLQNLVRERDREVVLNILKEEKKHLYQLWELKRKLKRS